MSSAGASNTSSQQDTIDLEKSDDKSISDSSSSYSSSKLVQPTDKKRVSKELMRRESAKENVYDHTLVHPITIDKTKKAGEGRVWVGTEEHPQTKEVAINEMTTVHLSKLFGFKTIKYLVSHDHDYLSPDQNGSFACHIKYGMSYTIAGLNENEDKCIRCRKLFKTHQNEQTCQYHPGERVLIDLKKRKRKKGDVQGVKPFLTEVWSCCRDEEINSSGCCKLKGHVGMTENNFKSTKLPGDEPLDPQYDTKKKSRMRKKREAKMQKYQPWQKPQSGRTSVIPAVNTF